MAEGKIVELDEIETLTKYRSFVEFESVEVIPEEIYKSFGIPENEWHAFEIKPMTQVQRARSKAIADRYASNDFLSAMVRSGVSMEELYNGKPTSDVDQNAKNVNLEAYYKITAHMTIDIDSVVECFAEVLEIVKECTIRFGSKDFKSNVDRFPMEYIPFLYREIVKISCLDGAEIQALLQKLLFVPAL